MRLSRSSRLLIGTAVAGITLGSALGCSRDAPPEETAPAWLLDRARAQQTLAAASRTLSDFSFSDSQASSGITFVNRIVDDAGRAYKAVHYDHGTGLAAADVDGDGLPDLYFVSQLGRNELWKNLGGGRFTDLTAASGLAMTDAVSVGASFGDVDNDGDPDLFVSTVRHGNRLFENIGAGKFRDISAAAGVDYVGHSSGALFVDVDADGLLDLFVTNVGVYSSDSTGHGGYYVGLEDAFFGHTFPARAETSILYRNLGGNRFQDVTRSSGLIDASWSGDAVAIDINDDDLQDIYVLNMQGENHLWLNEGGRRFRDATATYFPKTPFGAMGAKVFDFDGDQRLDLFVTDMHSDMFDMLVPGDWAGEGRKSAVAPMPPALFPKGTDRLIFGNALFANPGAQAGAPGGVFREVSDRLGVENYWPWGPSVDDLNADGWDDIFIASSMNFPYRYAINSVFLNEAGTHFLPSEFTLGIEPRAGGATDQPWFTLACEAGGADVGTKPCEACAQPNAADLGCRRDAAGQLTMTAARGSRAGVIVDLDADGDLDLVTNEFNAPPQLLLSDLAKRHEVHSLQLRLRGTQSNRQGLGAQVTVVLADGRRILKLMDGKSGYLSQSALPLYFGLGTAREASSIEIRWPSGRRQRVAGPVRAGQVLEIVEP